MLQSDHKGVFVVANMDPTFCYPDGVSPVSSSDSSSLEGLSPAQLSQLGSLGSPPTGNYALQGFVALPRGGSVSSVSSVASVASNAMDQFSYYLDLLRPQSPASSAKSPEEKRAESPGSEINKPKELRVVRKYPPLYSRPAPPDNLTIETVDSNYLQFFFLQAPMFLLFTQHFPSAPSAIFDLASQHAPTMDAILAVAAQHADMVVGRKPTRALIHLGKCLPQIQSALTNVQINEGHIAAVYCLTRLYFARRERIAARNHLHGLYLMLEAYQNASPVQSPASNSSPTSPEGYVPPRRPSPFMMFLWRIAIQMDLAIGSRGQDLVFPSPPPGQDDFHRTWISRIASPQATEWALAEFALDDLYHHSLYLEKIAIKIRESPYYSEDVDEPRIAAECEKLWTMHQHWKSRQVVREAAKAENLYRQQFPITDDTGQFLHYGPPLRFKNEFFVRMLLYHTERIIHIDLILRPFLTEPSERRVRAAIEVCRIIAGVRDMNEGKAIGQYFQGLNNAGIVFDPKIYPNGIVPIRNDRWLISEFKWVVEKLEEVDRVSGYDSGRMMVGILKQTWESDNPWQAYRRLSGQSVQS